MKKTLIFAAILCLALAACTQKPADDTLDYDKDVYDWLSGHVDTKSITHPTDYGVTAEDALKKFSTHLKENWEKLSAEMAFPGEYHGVLLSSGPYSGWSKAWKLELKGGTDGDTWADALYLNPDTGEIEIVQAPHRMVT